MEAVTADYVVRLSTLLCRSCFVFLFSFFILFFLFLLGQHREVSYFRSYREYVAAFGSGAGICLPCLGFIHCSFNTRLTSGESSQTLSTCFGERSTLSHSHRDFWQVFGRLDLGLWRAIAGGPLFIVGRALRVIGIWTFLLEFFLSDQLLYFTLSH